MKKTYIDPKMRVVNLTESDAILMDLSTTPANPDKNAGSRRSRLIDDWDEEEDW